MQAAKEAGLVALGAAWADTADASVLRGLEPAAVFEDVREFGAWMESHTRGRT
jgi:hypothetical protein